ncbi:MAG: hypothetical protein JO198_06975 [Candidatus Dormibacteraeota bacterium]|nr:hypothetical protein [Candidatus Dormibacteraeota bacterium]
MDGTGRPLTRIERAVAYGALGVAGEVTFTALRDLAGAGVGNARLEGRSYVWMLPIYGVAAYLFEPLHDALASRPVWQRAAAYAAGIMSVEMATGTGLRRLVGEVPWDYSGRSRWVVGGGAVRIDYAPLWAAVGLGLERVHARLRTLTITPGNT